MLRAITHVHTAFSWDSRMTIETLVSRVERLGLDLVLVSDHNSFEGSLALRKAASRNGLRVRVPTAAEIRTDRGDVVVVFGESGRPPDVSSMHRWSQLRRLVPEAGGLIWLPHPYRGHHEVEELAEHADVIEVFNARCSPKKDDRAQALCDMVGAVPAYGADSHLGRELGRVLVEYPDAQDLLDVFRRVPSCKAPLRALESDIMAAEVINGITERRPALVGYFAARYVAHRSREAVSKPKGGV